MNPQQELQFGIPVSGQHESPSDADFAFVEQIQSLIDRNSPEDALFAIYNYASENVGHSPLAGMGLNLQAIKNILKGYIDRKEYQEGLDIVKSIADILVFGIDNDEVFEKYINLLKLFNLKLLRLSVNWEKIVNQRTGSPDPSEINKYKQKCEHLIANGIEPIITFSHFETRGMDLHSEKFGHIFSRTADLLLDRLVEVGVRYFIAFNEPAVLSGGINFDFWGHNKDKVEHSKNIIGKMRRFGELVKGLDNHFRTLNRIGELSKEFYIIAHKKAVRYSMDVKVIANFNIAFFDLGTSPTAVDKFLKWLGEKIDRDAQINPFIFENGEKAFDILALNPYQIYNFALINRLLRAKIPKLLKKLYIGRFLSMSDLDLENLISDTSNPDFEDPEEVRQGSNGEILYPKAMQTVIKEIMTKFNIEEFVVTESGADIYSKTPGGVEDKIWYFNKVKDVLNQIRDSGVSMPFALFWTLIRMWEILGPHGGGIGKWDFGILGEPLHKEKIENLLVEKLDMNSSIARRMANDIVREGNTPIEIYDGMIENLGELFKSSEIFVDQIVEALIIQSKGGKYNIVVDILQILLLQDYYLKREDDVSFEYLGEILEQLMAEFESNRDLSEIVRES